jgi:hypothetical protein
MKKQLESPAGQDVIEDVMQEVTHANGSSETRA